MSKFSDLLRASFPEGWSNREVARRADQLGVALSRATVDKYTGEDHGTPTEATIQAFHAALNIPINALRGAAGVPVGEGEPYTPPPEAARLSRRQRRALDELIRSFVAPADTAKPESADVAAHHSQTEHRQAEQWRTGIPDEGMPRDLSEDGYPATFMGTFDPPLPNRPNTPTAEQDAPSSSARPPRQ